MPCRVVACAQYFPKLCCDAACSTQGANSEKEHSGLGKSDKAHGGGGRAGAHSEADTAHPRAVSQSEVKRDRKPASSRKSSSTISRGDGAKTGGGGTGGGGGRRGTPSTEPAATSSLNAEIRGLFERATKVTFALKNCVWLTTVLISLCCLSRQNGTRARKVLLTKTRHRAHVLR